MYRTLIACAAIVWATSAAPAAQPQPGSQPAGKPTTIIGCLRSTPNPDPAGTAGKSPVYTMDVIPAPMPPRPETSSMPKPGSVADAVKATTYTLTAPESVGLAKHVGHRVEVTGQLQDTGTKAKESPGTRGGTPDAMAPKPGGAHNTFEVTALKMVSAQCEDAR
jgi:hypothetical protein